jgi:hypothetical protein
MLNYNPRRRSYSSITTSGLYAFIVAELWHWTGDANLVRPFIEPALRALQWLERDGDIDGDGFYEYRTRSPMGPIHQAWKDSPDAIVYEDGALVEPPIATCEEQAFVYVAKLHLAETLWFLGEHEMSRKLHHQAVELKKRFNDAFWMEEEGFYALALDAQKRPVRSIASNAGHCIAAAIADAFARCPAITRATTPTAITSARSGLSSTERSPPASGDTACTIACSRSRAPNSTRRRCSNTTACPSSSAATRATGSTPSPASIRTRIHCRRGRRLPCSCSCRRCSASIRTRH